MNMHDDERKREVRTYLVGYAAALALTGAAFAAVHWGLAQAPKLLALVLALGFLQIVVQFRCFLHISLARSSRDDLQLILFSALIIALWSAAPW